MGWSLIPYCLWEAKSKTMVFIRGAGGRKSWKLIFICTDDVEDRVNMRANKKRESLGYYIDKAEGIRVK